MTGEGSPEAGKKAAEDAAKKQEAAKETVQDDRVKQTHELLERLHKQLDSKADAAAIQTMLNDARTSLQTLETLDPSIRDQLGPENVRKQMQEMINAMIDDPNEANRKALAGLIDSTFSDRGILSLGQLRSADDVEQVLQKRVKTLLARPEMEPFLKRFGMSSESAGAFVFTWLRAMVAGKLATFGLGTAGEGAFANAREIGRGLNRNMLIDGFREQLVKNAPTGEQAALRGLSRKQIVERMEADQPGALARWEKLYDRWLAYASNEAQSARNASPRRKPQFPPAPVLKNAIDWTAAEDESKIPVYLRSQEGVKKEAEAKAKEVAAPVVIAGLNFGTENRVQFDATERSIAVGGSAVRFQKVGDAYKMHVGTRENLTVELTAGTLNGVSLRPNGAAAGEVKLCINEETNGVKLSDLITEVNKGENAGKTKIRIAPPNTLSMA